MYIEQDIMHLEFIPTHTTSTHPLKVSSPHNIKGFILFYIIISRLLHYNQIGKGSPMILMMQ